jgi:hypothetical protein
VNRFYCLQVITKNNYNTIAISTLYSSLEHTVQCSQSVTRRFLVTAPAMAIPNSSSSPLFRDSCTELSTDFVPRLLHLGMDHTENAVLPLLQSNCYIVKNLLPSNRNMFPKLLHRKGSGISAHLAVIPQQQLLHATCGSMIRCKLVQVNHHHSAFLIGGGKTT